LTKPSYDQARFGGNFGGPVIIPKMRKVGSARAFYITYQGNLSRNPYSQISSVPTLAERMGDFSQTTNRACP